MLIRCWGARGSIPVSGREYLRYGGDTTCLEVRNGAGEIIVIDAGTGIRRLGHRLAAEGPCEVDILFTHAHWDHLLGFPFFRPLYRDDSRVRIYGCPCAQSSVRDYISATMAPPNFPIPLGALHAEVTFHENCGESFYLGKVAVTPIFLSHPNGGLGYKLAEDGRSLVFLTDNELRYRHVGGRTFEEYVAFCAGADLLIHDADLVAEEYARARGWGHSTAQDALDLAVAAGVRGLGLFHHNPDRTDEEVDRIVEGCREAAARRGASLECFAVAWDWECTL